VQAPSVPPLAREYWNGRRSPETPEGFIEACDAAVAIDIAESQTYGVSN
jgi:hypothetical protein